MAETKRTLLTRIDATNQQLVSLVVQLQTKVQMLMAKIDDLTAQVAANTTVIGSAEVLIAGFSTRLDAAIAEAKAGNDTALDALSSELKTNDDALAAAVAANTPGQPPTSPARP